VIEAADLAALVYRHDGHHRHQDLAEFLNKSGYPWATKVQRIILLAGMNRGWSISYHLNMWRALAWWLGGIIVRPLIWVRSVIVPGAHLDPVIFTVRRGGHFITQLRIQWLRMRQAASANLGKALTIQLLGSVDDFVSPTDNIDLISGGDLVYLDVLHSGHSSVIDMSDPDYGPARSDVLRMVLTAPQDILARESLPPQDNQGRVPSTKSKT
jgi:hypothetical protein